ncbi:MAG: insulinase family protein [Paracoccaceae bacterium]
MLDNTTQAVVTRITAHRSSRTWSASAPDRQTKSAANPWIAHFLKYLTFKGTKDVPDGQFSQIVEAQGGL